MKRDIILGHREHAFLFLYMIVSKLIYFSFFDKPLETESYIGFDDQVASIK